MTNILPGDAIRRRKRLIWHYGLYAGKVNGKEMVFENTLNGIRLVALEEFEKGKECEFIPYNGKTKREDVIARANSILGKKRYNLLKNNCEHFVTWCQEGKAKSLQVRKGIKISAGATLAAIGIGLTGKIIYDKIKKRRNLTR